MATLKNITDLPVVESADGLNLIVNDNGSAKQIAINTIRTQDNWDAIIDLGTIAYASDLDASTFTLVSGNFDNLMTKLQNGQMPKILFKRMFTYGDIFYEYYTPTQISLAGSSTINMSWAISDNLTYIGFMSVKLNSDYTFEYKYTGK